MAEAQATRGDGRFGGPRDGVVRVVFLVVSATVWPSLESVWQACSRDPRFIARVILTPNRFPDRQSQEFHQARAMLAREDIPFSYAYEGVLDDFKPDVVFVPSPYDEMLPPFLGLDALEAAGARIAYVPYGLEIGGGGFNMQYQFNLPVQQRAWRIFARSASHRRMFARYCESGTGHVVVTGPPRLDRLARLDECDASHLEARIGGRTALLWTPHFKDGPSALWSSFGRFRDHILETFAARAKTHALIFRPHPLLFSTLRADRYWTPAEEEAFRQRLAGIDNVILDESGSYLPAFKAADGLMGDAGSFLLEFFATGKPLLYLSPEDGVGLNDDAHLLDQLYVCGDAEDIPRFVDQVAAGEDPMAERRRQALPEFLHRPDSGTVGEAIAEHLAEAVLAGDDIRVRRFPKDALHGKAREYWSGATDTYLATPDYYDRQEEALREVVARHGPWKTAVDVGCGDGRYTLVIAEKAERVTACDISPKLIEQARQQAHAKGATNVDWRVESLDEVRTLSRYDLCCCAGVLSGFIDIRAYAMAISSLRAMTRPQGLLITKESLSRKQQVIARNPQTGYVAIYRNAHDYVDSFVQQGFELVEKVLLNENQQAGLENAYFVFRRV